MEVKRIPSKTELHYIIREMEYYQGVVAAMATSVENNGISDMLCDVQDSMRKAEKMFLEIAGDEVEEDE